LVAELERSGRLTREEAAVHPQRSVITRALGAGPELEVDTSVVQVRDGDVLLLCSDGLSGLIGDEAIGRLIGGGGSLDEAVRRLVRAANDAGGDDNVTAVAFRIAGDPVEGPPVEARTVDERDLSDTLTEAVPAIRMPTSEPLLGQPPARHRIRLRTILAFTTFVLVVAALAVGAVGGLYWSHFVGVDPATGRVAVFQGVPFEITKSHRLYRLVARSSVMASSLPRSERQRLFDHKLRSSSDAERVLRQLQATEP
jgi:protein phosphatase